MRTHTDTHTQKPTHATLNVLCFLSKRAFVYVISRNQWKRNSWNPRRVFACVCVFASMYAPVHALSSMFPRTYLSCAVLRAWERWRHSVNDDYDDGVYLSAEVEKGRPGGLNECSVRGCGEGSSGQEERGSEEDGEGGRGVNSTLCGEWEKRVSLLWYVYMSMWFLVWLIVSVCSRAGVCVCLCYRMGFHIEILSVLMVYIKWDHYIYYVLSVVQWYVAACNII